jgi:hypothetical protein
MRLLAERDAPWWCAVPGWRGSGHRGLHLEPARARYLARTGRVVGWLRRLGRWPLAPNGWGGDRGRTCPIPELRRSTPWDSAGEAFPPQGATRCVRIRRGSLERRLCIEPYEDALGRSAALALDDGGPPSDDRRARAQRAATTDSQVPGHHPRSLILPTPPALGPNRRNRGRRRARREPLRLVHS